MNTFEKNPALSSGAIFWIFIIISLLVHSLFLMINQSASNKVAQTNSRPSLEITLQQTTPATPIEPTPHRIAENKTEAAKPASTQTNTITSDSKVATTVTVNPTTPPTVKQSGQKIDAVQIRADALRWLQRQANTQFDDSARLRQLVSFSHQPIYTGTSYSSYQSEWGKTQVVFNTATAKRCAEIRHADPLDSFDQSVWMVNFACQG